MAALLLASAWAFAAQAYTTFKGVSVDYGNANASLVDGELVLQYKTAGTSSLTISGGAVMADILVVGGGGGGGGAKRQSSSTTKNRYGAGGNGGSVRLFENQVLLEGMSYDVTVGAGGTAGIGSSQTAGGKGWASSFGDLEEQSGGKGGSANVTTSTPGKGASGSGTEGVTNSISGSSVKYGEGGMSGGGGGTDNQGNGGGGAAQTSSDTITRNGGEGGSGVVIVRMTKAIPGKLVDNLAITETIVAGADGTFSPIASVPEGVTLTGETSASDIGHYQFVASLKPGYVWRDGLVSTPRIYSWSVVEKAEDARTWINVTKAVHTDPNDPSNAWIAVRGMLPQQQYVPNVLFLGTECNAHSLTAKNLQDAIEAIAQVANIDWYIFKSTTASGDSNKDIDRSGTMLKGDKFASKGYADLVLDNNNHHAARRFYETLDAVRLDAARSNKYDFIILEFDGSRLADQYTQNSEKDTAGSLGPYANEAKVAEFLKPYYARERIFWMVDNHAANSGQSGTVEPWDDGYYRPNTYFHNNYNNILTDAEYKGLIGLLDPEHYDPDVTTAAKLAETNRGWQPALCKCTINKKSYEWYDKGTGGNGKRTIYANRRYSRQVFYDDGDTLKENLLDFINAKYRLLFLDKIVEDLEVVSAKFYRSFSTEDGKTMWDDSDGWELVAEQEAGSDPVYYDTSGNASISIVGQEVSSSLSNLNSAVWGKMEIHVRDSGSFKDGVVPEYDEASGKWIGKKSPNNGVAMVTRYDKTGAVEASGKASTGIFWEYPAYTVEGVVTNGTLWIDGVETNETHKIEGSDCSVTYRGDPGYALDSITVDGTPLTADEINEHLSDYGFTNIKADHEVVVVYTNFVVTSEPYTNYYDGAEHGITVNLPDYHDDITDVKVQYSTDGETYVDTKPVYSNVEHTVVYYKVVGHQAGYGDEEITLATGFDTVDILPREVNVTAKSAKKFYDGEELTAGYEVQHDYADDLRENGWGFVGTDDITTVKMTGESVIGADAAKTEKQTVGNVIDPDQTRFTSDEIAGNYIVHYTDGELEVIPVAVKPVVKVYDGAPTNVEVVVTDPPAGTTIRYSYDKDGGYAEAGELTFTGPTNAWESADVWVEVSAPGYGAVTNFAMVTILRRYVVEQAGSASKPFDNTPLVCGDHDERPAEELKDALAVYKDLYGEELASSATGFVGADAFASVPMTGDSTITNPGVVSNTINSAAVTFTPSYDPDNYSVRYLQGELKVTSAPFTASAEPVEKFYDGIPTNITYVVTNAAGGVISDATIFLREKNTTEWIPVADFVPYVDTTNVTVEVKAEKAGFDPVTAEATVTILPRVVVQKAGDASKDFDGTPLRCDDSDEKPERELEEAERIYGEDGADAIGFVSGEGFATVPMTADSEQTEPGTHTNLIDKGAVTLAEGTKPDNYVLFFDPGLLTVIQRQKEVRRDPNILEESRKVVEEADKKIEKTLDEMAKADQEATDAPYVKYQLTVTPTNHLDETTRTTPEKAAEDAKNQIELAESKTGSKIDKVEFVDIVLERTYSKEEAEATASGDYNKDNWEPLDKAEEHGNALFEVVIPVEVPEGMELIGVTRSCVKGGETKDEILKPKDPNDPGAEGFVYDPATKTVTLYAKDFCVFGFMMQKTSQGGGGGCSLPGECEEVCLPPVWDFQMVLRADTLCQGVGYVKVSHCGIDREVCGCYRELQTINYSGVWYGCSCGCQLQEDGINVIMADMTRKIKYADGWFEPVSSVDFSGGDLYRFGAYASKVAARFALRFGDRSELQFVGFGNYPLDMSYLQSISGRITGVIDASKSCNGNGHCGIYPLCRPGVNAADPTTWPADETLPGAETAVAFGLFQVRFNASASARLGASRDKGTGKFDIMKIVPSWFAK